MARVGKAPEQANARDRAPRQARQGGKRILASHDIFGAGAILGAGSLGLGSICPTVLPLFAQVPVPNETTFGQVVVDTRPNRLPRQRPSGRSASYYE